jgi:serine/threonine protein kinase
MTRWQREGAERLSETVGTGWTLESVIGSGGTATVYRAHGQDGRQAAVKLMHEHLVGNWSRRFEREARLLSRLKEPSVVELYEFGRKTGVPFLVLELLSGESLDRVQLPAQLSARVSAITAYARQALKTIELVHGCGVLHRDLKPSNLFLTSSGALKVLDFGAASSEQRDLTRTDSLTSGLLGTPAFMSPEQARGRWDLVDERSDIWSLAATLFTLLSGEHVHPGRTRNEQLGRAMSATARPVGSVLPKLDPAIARVLDQALAYRREHRFQSALAFREALEGRQPRLELTGSTVGADSTVRQLPTTRARPLSYLAPFTGALALGLGFFLLTEVRATSKPVTPAALEPKVVGAKTFETSVSGNAQYPREQLAATTIQQPSRPPQQRQSRLKAPLLNTKLAVPPPSKPPSPPGPSAAIPSPRVNPLDVRGGAEVKTPILARQSFPPAPQVPRDLARTALDVRN